MWPSILPLALAVNILRDGSEVSVGEIDGRDVVPFKCRSGSDVDAKGGGSDYGCDRDKPTFIDQPLLCTI